MKLVCSSLSSKHNMDRVISIVLFLLITLIQTPATFCQNDKNNYYETCGEPFTCANLKDIGYPFWGGSRPVNCGHPDFELSCSDEYPEITIRTVKYKVNSTDNGTKTAVIARDDLLSDICPSNPQNATLEFNRFDYVSSGDRNITLFYGCTITNPVSSFGQIPNLFNCSGDNSDRYGLWSPNTGLPIFQNIVVTCDTQIIVTVAQGSFDALFRATIVSEDLVKTAVSSGFSVQWKANNSLCDDCTKTGGRCGSNGILKEFVCYCTDGTSSPLTCGHGAENSKGKTSSLGIGLGVSGAVLAGVGIGWLIFRQKRTWVAAQAPDLEQVQSVETKKRGDERLKDIETFIRSNGYHSLKLYTYSDIKKMTNSFNDKIGQGGFGSVYRGKLPDGRLIAVKLLTKTKGNGEEFINEVASISRTSHINIVTLLGFSYHRKRALVYEFMPNGSLDKFIGNKGLPNTSCQLEWKTLYQIAIGIARGLEYLYLGCNTRIMHFDIKPNNILLDKDFTPKISDFGLAKLCKKEESVQSLSMFGARGTIGYIAPEVFFRSFGGVSHKSDVYSYGMTVIDMVGLRENVDTGDQTSELYFPNWIYDHIDQGFDFKLEGITNEEDKEMAMKMILVSLWCIQTNPADRPSIRRVVEMLEGSIASLVIPAKPFFCPPIVLPQQSSTSLITT